MSLLRRTQRLLNLSSKYISRNCRCLSDGTRLTSRRDKIKQGPGLKEFIIGDSEPVLVDRPHIPYLPENVTFASNRKVYFDVYGCQMNLNDTEIVWSILKKEGFEKTEVEEEADIFLVMTCAIREGAESKIWHRLDHLRGFKRRRAQKNKERPVKIGLLGCMAERLKTKLIEKEKAVDVVAGPDSYRDLPRLLALTESGQTAVNVLLSLDETYADVMPVRLNQDSVSAFISIMRGCDNMCTYCIVPFTRGRERSRPLRSIVDEARSLADRGVKEITLLGQNVNSYRDPRENPEDKERLDTQLAKGFKTVYKPKKGGLRFADLLDQVSAAVPDVRVRFTAAHPKDFPDEVLQVINERPNICKLLHLPAQSGSTSVLERMRRGYTREAYLQLVDHVKNTIPGVGLSTDMICGFCGETDEEFEETMTLMQQVDYNIAFLFPYSMREVNKPKVYSCLRYASSRDTFILVRAPAAGIRRGGQRHLVTHEALKTAAHRRYKDDVPDSVKKLRHNRMIHLYRTKSQALNQSEIGNTHLVLIEGTTKTGQLLGRNEFYMKVVFDQCEIVSQDGGKVNIKSGDFVAVKISGAKSSVLTGVPMYHTGVKDFYRHVNWGQRHVLRV